MRGQSSEKGVEGVCIRGSKSYYGPEKKEKERKSGGRKKKKKARCLSKRGGEIPNST